MQAPLHPPVSYAGQRQRHRRREGERDPARLLRRCDPPDPRDLANQYPDHTLDCFGAVQGKYKGSNPALASHSDSGLTISQGDESARNPGLRITIHGRYKVFSIWGHARGFRLRVPQLGLVYPASCIWTSQKAEYVELQVLA